MSGGSLAATFFFSFLGSLAFRHRSLFVFNRVVQMFPFISFSLQRDQAQLLELVAGRLTKNTLIPVRSGFPRRRRIFCMLINRE